MTRIRLHASMHSICVILVVFLSLSCFLFTLVLSQHQLEAGEIVIDTANPPPPFIEEGPSTLVAATCNSAESRKARAIVKDLFLPSLPSEYILPQSCPFHPALDLLLQEDKAKVKLNNNRFQDVWKCTKCNRVFSSQFFIDQHIQNRHMQHAGLNQICLSDYCDVLDCFHRSVNFDPLTGDLLADGASTGLYGTARDRERKMQALQLGLKNLDKEGPGAVGAALAAQQGRNTLVHPPTPLAAQVEHPHAKRCSDDSMARAKLKCESVLLNCFPFHGGNHAHGLPSKAVHELYDKFHKVFCESLRCDDDGIHANAREVVGYFGGTARGRVWTIVGVLFLFFLGVFYFLMWHLRGEFGFIHSGTNSLTSHLKERQINRFMKWMGMQQKKRTAASKII